MELNISKDKINAIASGLTSIGLTEHKDFGIGCRPESGECVIHFNLPGEGFFHAVIEPTPVLKTSPRLQESLHLQEGMHQD